MEILLLEPGGSYFCEKCNLEYSKEGKCDCGGEIRFVHMFSNDYLSVWMKSRKALDKKLKG